MPLEGGALLNWQPELQLTIRLDAADKPGGARVAVAENRQPHCSDKQPVDLVQAASNPLKEVNKGGTTRFDEFSGLLSVDAAGYHFRKLKVSWCHERKAQGKVDIFPQQQLLDTDLKGTATLISRRSWFPAHCASRYCVPPARR